MTVTKVLKLLPLIWFRRIVFTIAIFRIGRQNCCSLIEIQGDVALEMD